MQESIAINVAHKVEAPRVSRLIAAEEVIDHQSWMNRFTHVLATGERKRGWASIEDMDACGARQVLMNLIIISRNARVYARSCGSLVTGSRCG